MEAHKVSSITSNPAAAAAPVSFKHFNPRTAAADVIRQIFCPKSSERLILFKATLHISGSPEEVEEMEEDEKEEKEEE